MSARTLSPLVLCTVLSLLTACGFRSRSIDVQMTADQDVVDAAVAASAFIGIAVRSDHGATYIALEPADEFPAEGIFDHYGVGPCGSLSSFQVLAYAGPEVESWDDLQSAPLAISDPVEAEPPCLEAHPEEGAMLVEVHLAMD